MRRPLPNSAAASLKPNNKAFLATIILLLSLLAHRLPRPVRSFTATATTTITRTIRGGGCGSGGTFPSTTAFLFPQNQPREGACSSSSHKKMTTSTSDSAAAAAEPPKVSTTAAAAAAAAAVEQQDDPYIWLEDVESEASLAFAKESNAACLEALGDPTAAAATSTYDRVLAVLESDDRIPTVSQYGTIEDDVGEPILYNFWKDARNPKGLWRKTTLAEYLKEQPAWQTVLDVDALAVEDNISWVFKGNTPLPRARDNDHNQVRRCLLQLSRGGSDAVHVREFDLETQQFVTAEQHRFNLPEAKTRASYKSRDVLLVGSDFGPGSLTDSGYPRQVREWVRGTDLADAPVVFEGAQTDVSVGLYISDERVWGGGIYEVRYRSLTFYTSKYWCRKIAPEHLLAPSDPQRVAARTEDEPPEFVPVDIQDDASISFLGQMAIISLRSDWEPKPGVKFHRGSVIVTNADQFLERGAAGGCEYTPLFEPSERTAYEYHVSTKNYLILSTLDTVKSKLEFFKIAENGSKLVRVETESAEPQIRDCSCRPVDPYAGSDEFFFTTSDYTTPSTLFLADAAQVETDSNRPDAFIKQKLKSLPPQYDSSNLVVEQRMATSKDGTEIPYFIIMPKDLVLDGTTPTLLYGYGGFEVSLGPHYIATSGLAWLERGGVYVEANIRGGGEFGPSWHQAALKAHRHKAYEDFIAVAEDLIGRKICTSKTLAARGGSNGGLLMGNMYTMRPQLFGAIHCAVPLLDMKRYHTLLAGASWMAEYGNPDTDDWAYLKQYSPYHNIDPDANYPPILVTTSTRDDRVHPGHARKFVKKLQDMGKGKWPVYYYENIEGGHGGAADAKQSAFMTSLAYDFMFETLSKNRS